MKQICGDLIIFVVVVNYYIKKIKKFILIKIFIYFSKEKNLIFKFFRDILFIFRLHLMLKLCSNVIYFLNVINSIKLFYFFININVFVLYSIKYSSFFVVVLSDFDLKYYRNNSFFGI